MIYVRVVCMISSSTQKYDTWVCFLEPKSNKKQLWSKPLWPGGENPCQPNLVAGVMIYWIECPLKWNQWSYSRATSICWDCGACGFRGLLYPLRRLGVNSINVKSLQQGTFPPHRLQHISSQCWVFKTGNCGWYSAVVVFFFVRTWLKNVLTVTIIYSGLKVEVYCIVG